MAIINIYVAQTQSLLFSVYWINVLGRALIGNTFDSVQGDNAASSERRHHSSWR